MISIWERNSFCKYNYIVLGGGIVGLSTAYYLKKRFPLKSVLVLERGVLPTGASTKNAGFACMGSPSELLNDLKQNSEEDVVALFLLRKKGLERLRKMLGEKNIGYAENGSYELLFEKDKWVLDKIDYLNGLLSKELGCAAFRAVHDKLDQFRFGNEVKGLIENNCEGEIDTGMMMQSLIRLAIAEGVDIRTGAEVISYQEGGAKVVVECKNQYTHEGIPFEADNLFLCTNAFAKQFLPNADISPGRGQVLITKPIPNLPFKGIFHFDAGYYYFREYRGCVLFGGGRNLDFSLENTTDFTLNEIIQAELERRLNEIILPDLPFEIDLRWTGIMAFGETKRPILEQLSERVFAGVRMGGMGVAIGTEIGWQLADMIA